MLNARVDIFLHGTGNPADRFKQAVERAIAHRETVATASFRLD